MVYFTVKLIHIVSATLILGTGIGTAYFMLSAYRSRNAAAIRVTSRHVVLADWIFIAPAVVLQLVTGLWLSSYLGVPYGSAWFISVLGLFALVGACWLPVVWIQIRLSRLIGAREDGGLPKRFSRLMRVWIALGIPGFGLTVVLLLLMVFRPGMNWILVGGQ